MDKTNILQSEEDRMSFGHLPDGREVSSYTIANENGMEASVINYGATITTLKVPALNGEVVDVVPGFETLEGYVDSYSVPSPPYFGAVIGRYSGRIRNGEFSINGKKHRTTANHGEHTLHGGTFGFGQKFWELEARSANAITLSYTSPDGEEGFPGELKVKVTYTLTDANELRVEYRAETTEDTVLNLTQHSYFNLEGHSQAVSGQKVVVNSNKMLDTTPDGIPTGVVVNVDKGPYDLTSPRLCPAKIDTTFVTEDNTMPVASLSSKRTGLKMTVHTDQPSVHVYVGGNCFGQVAGKEGAQYHPLSGICFEAQHYPDSPNHPHFPSTVLKKGEEYYQRTSFKFENL
jgi:aldose 1-epimerase